MAFRQAFNTLKKYPLIMNSSFYVGLYGSSELCQQTMRKQTPKDARSIANVAILGGSAFAPFNVFWYRFLDSKVVGAGMRIAFKKLACDQAIAGVYGVVMFFVGLAILEGRSDMFAELKQKGLETYKTSCMFWPTIQMCNFLFVPSYLRALYVGCAAFIWSNILCIMKNK